jgi:hypothetical protein
MSIEKNSMTSSGIETATFRLVGIVYYINKKGKIIPVTGRGGP